MKSNLQWMWSKLGKNSPPNHTHVYPFLVPGSVSSLAGGSNHHHTREWPACKKKKEKKNATEGKNAFTADRSSRSFQLSKKLFNAFHKSDQTSFSHYSIWFRGSPSCHSMPGQLRKSEPELQKQWGGTLKSQTRIQCMFSFFAQRRL